MANPSVNQVMNALRELGVNPMLFEEQDGNLCVSLGLTYPDNWMNSGVSYDDVPLHNHSTGGLGDDHV